MALRDGEKASEGALEKGKLVVGDEAADDPHEKKAVMDPQPSNLRLKKRLEYFLRPFEKEELFDLLVQIGTKIPATAEEIRDAVNEDPRSRKVFVGSLNPKTTKETLCATFSSFGEIEEGVVMYDPETRNSYCFGFITFKNCESVQEALENSPRKIDDFSVSCSRALDLWVRLSREIQVSGLPQDVSTKTLLDHFSKYGEIEEGMVIRDIEQNTSMGYGYVMFKTIEGARKAHRDPQQFIGETRIYVRYSESEPRKTKRPRIMPSESTVPVPPS